jgi:hypothetical protein
MKVAVHAGLHAQIIVQIVIDLVDPADIVIAALDQRASLGSPLFRERRRRELPLE